MRLPLTADAFSYDIHSLILSFTRCTQAINLSGLREMRRKVQSQKRNSKLTCRERRVRVGTAAVGCQVERSSTVLIRSKTQTLR
jgi:hypothetical protein